MNVPKIDLTKFEPVFGWAFDGPLPHVVIRCPNGHIANLDSHVIQDSGVVGPSVQCPKCAFHENVVLKDWK